MKMTLEAKSLAPGAGRTYRYGGSDTIFKITSDETGDRYEIHESTLSPGGGPPPHIHGEVIHAFFVLEGEVEYWVGEQRLQTPKGGFVFVPAGIPHTFRNHGQTTARWLQIDSPGGRERMFKEFSEKLGGASTPEEQRLLGEILQKYDTVLAKEQ
jgi:quercetin dioxygenase-like cupin family protein